MIKNLSKVFLVSIVIAALFLGFMYFIGIPKTQARNYYNLAIQDEAKGDTQKELQDLKTAINFWPEEYILQKLQQVND